MRSLSCQPSPIRILVFIGILGVLWLPIYGVMTAVVKDSNTASLISMVVLFIEFLLLNQWWNRVMYGRDRPWSCYGLSWSRSNRHGALVGLGVGALSLFLLFATQSFLGWISWQPFPVSLMISQLRIALEGLLVAIGVAFGEEVVFRGWLLDEIEQDYGPTIALWSTSFLFAVLHFIRPLADIIRTFPQFPGLVLLGLIMVWAKRSHQNQLGISIGLHCGLVWGYYMINVGDRVQYHGVVSDWWTGVNQNPLAGFLGLGFLGILSLWFRQRAIVAIRSH